MHIAVLTNYHLDQVGGAEEALDRLAGHWHAAGHEVTLFAAQAARSQRPRAWQPNYRVVPFVRPFSTRFGLSRYVRFLLRQHAARPFDIVLAADAYWPGHVARRFALRTGVPYVVCSHGSDIREGSRFLRRRLTKERLTLAIRDAAGVAAISRYMLRRVYAVAPPRGIVRLTCNGWPDEWLTDAPAPPATPGKYLLAMGRLVAVKGFQTLVEAYALLRAKHPHVGLVIAGDGDYLPELLELAERHGLPVRRALPAPMMPLSGLCFPGFVQGALKRSLIEHAYLGVCPSIWQEPQGMVVLEMLCRGLPVVASAVGGIPDIVQPGVNGELYPAGDSGRLAALLDRLLCDEAERDRLASAARSSVEPYRWSAVAERYLQLFHEVRAGAEHHAASRRIVA
jgi:glycogen(starch) synthase